LLYTLKTTNELDRYSRRLLYMYRLHRPVQVYNPGSNITYSIPYQPGLVTSNGITILVKNINLNLKINKY